MLADNFRIALFAQVSAGPYDQPDKLRPLGSTWMIAERSGPRGTLLQLSEASAPLTATDGRAPDDLYPRTTRVAILVAPWDRPDPQASFLFLRAAPPGMRIDAPFFPADGFAQLDMTDSRPAALHAAGRHFHTRGTVSGQAVFADVAHPAAGAPGGQSWQITATRRPWINEV